MLWFGVENKKIAVIYQNYPHYRKAIVKALAASSNYNFVFIGSAVPVTPSIKLMEFPSDIKFIDARCKKVGPFLFQSSVQKILKKERVDGVILLGNVWYLSYWRVCLQSMITRRPVWFWTHGWINTDELILVRYIRNIFYRMAKGLMLYGHRAKEIGQSYGFDESKMFVIGNSLDFVGMSKIFSRVREKNRDELKKELSLFANRSLLICSARLTPLCRFDLLIDAVALLGEKKNKICIVLIGDGPEKEKLSALGVARGVEIHFVGACYDEEIIAKYYHCADISVSPGKIGLTAMHSMTYGTPAISHNNLDKQMPEFEAIVPELTGDLFEYNDAKDLSITIDKWLFVKTKQPEVIDKCINVIQENFSPASQVDAIESALDKYWSA